MEKINIGDAFIYPMPVALKSGYTTSDLLLGAADGINQPQGKKIAPLGRAVSPLNLYPVVGSGSSSLFWTGNACL